MSFLKNFQAKVSEVIEEICCPLVWSKAKGGGSLEKLASGIPKETRLKKIVAMTKNGNLNWQKLKVEWWVGYEKNKNEWFKLLWKEKNTISCSQ
jgi:hypothetical protein